MKRKIMLIVTALMLIISIPITAFAHSGRTDANGGHWNRKTGTYHYHNGGSSSSSNSSSYSYTTTKKTVYSSKVTISNPPETIDAGSSVNLTATVYPSDSVDNEISWESSNPEVAKISDNNELVAVGVGTTIITAKTSTGTYSSFTVEVKEVVATGIKIDEVNATITIGDSQLLNVNFEPNNTTYKNIVWNSSDNDIVTVSNEGLLNAVGVGTATVTATHKDIADSIVIEVLPIKAESVLIEYPYELEENEKSGNPKIKVNDTFIFKAEVSPSDTTDKTIEWSVNDEEKATIDDNGNFTALKSGTITVTVATENGKTDTIEIDIYSNTPKIIAVVTIVSFLIGTTFVYCLLKKRSKNSTEVKILEESFDEQ